MKFNSIILVLTTVVLMTGCMKEGDFSELRHPLVIEGDFDPVLGIPIAKMSADMGDIVRVLDSSKNLSLYIGEDDLVVLRYYEVQHTLFRFDVSKKRKDTSLPDTFYYNNTVVGSVPISLFNHLNRMADEGLSTNAIYVTMDADLKGYVNDSILSLVEHGAKVYFDSIVLDVLCHDGFRQRIDMADTVSRIPLNDLRNGKLVHIIDHYNCDYLIDHRPKDVRYALRMNVEVPIADWSTWNPVDYVDSLGVDSLRSTFYTNVDFPLEVYCKNISFTDTVGINLSNIDSLLDAAEMQLTLNDSSSYIVFEAKNYIPITMSLNVGLLDANYNVLQDRVLESDSAFVGAPIRRKTMANLYESDGYTKSRIVLPLDMAMLRKLAKTKFLKMTITGNTSTTSALEEFPKVAVYEKDKIDLRTYIVVSPHVHLNVPVEINLLNK